MRALMLALALISSSCAKRSESLDSRTIDDPKALDNLKSQAADVGRALVGEDHARMVDLTHPNLVGQLGGRDALIKTLKKTAKDMRRKGVKIQSFDFGTPSALVQSAGSLYAVYPHSLTLLGPRGEKVRASSYLIGESSDGGGHWKFLEGEGVKTDRKKLKLLLPHFPDILSLPEPPAMEVDR